MLRSEKSSCKHCYKKKKQHYVLDGVFFCDALCMLCSRPHAQHLPCGALHRCPEDAEGAAAFADSLLAGVCERGGRESEREEGGKRNTEREGGREGEREGGRERGREGGKEGNRDREGGGREGEYLWRRAGLVASGDVLGVVRGMQGHATSKRVQEKACKAIANMADSDPRQQVSLSPLDRSCARTHIARTHTAAGSFWSLAPSLHFPFGEAFLATQHLTIDP